MAKLFIKQAEYYAQGRPSYPQELFEFIASKTPSHDIAWDVGTGNGQAAVQLAKIYENVIATDTSSTQLKFAEKHPNIQYKCTPPIISMSELEHIVAPQSSIDLVTVAQALHWFDLEIFYQQAKWIMKKPNGVIAIWGCTVPKVNPSVDFLFNKFNIIDAGPYWKPARKLAQDKYEKIDFPFEPVDGLENTEPLRFNAEKMMDLSLYFTYLRSFSAYQIGKEKGVELLSDEVIEDFKRAWNEDGESVKVVKFPCYLRIGKVGLPN